MNSLPLSNKKLSLLITLIYVTLGTIYALFYWTGSMSNLAVWGMILFYFFAPASFFCIAIIFTTQNPVFAIIIGQALTFLVLWGPVYLLVRFIRSFANSKKIR